MPARPGVTRPTETEHKLRHRSPGNVRPDYRTLRMEAVSRNAFRGYGASGVPRQTEAARFYFTHSLPDIYHEPRGQDTRRTASSGLRMIRCARLPRAVARGGSADHPVTPVSRLRSLFLHVCRVLEGFYRRPACSLRRAVRAAYRALCLHHLCTTMDECSHHGLTRVLLVVPVCRDHGQEALRFRLLIELRAKPLVQHVGRHISPRSVMRNIESIDAG